MVDDSEASEQCGTHIHVSPSGGWDVDGLIEISKCAIYFESAINALLPAHRRSNKWAASNRVDNPNLARKGMEQIFREIERCDNLDELIQLMNPDYDRYYAWNFTNVEEDVKGTVEFRKPPAALRCEDAIGWVEFTISFLRAALNSVVKLEVGDMIEFGHDISGLRRFLRLASPSNEGLRYIDYLFEGKTGQVFPIPVGPLDEETRRLMKLKKEAEKAKKLSLISTLTKTHIGL